MKNIKDIICESAGTITWNLTTDQMLAIYAALNLSYEFVPLEDVAEMLHIDRNVFDELEEDFGDEVTKAVKKSEQFKDLKACGQISKKLKKFCN